MRFSDSLNEGRGINPGDTINDRSGDTRHLQRSTKAGASTPATLVACGRASRRSKVAQRRPGHQPRRHCFQAAGFLGCASLNEGRGINPGDTPEPFWLLYDFNDAQRRPGHQPRRHRRKRVVAVLVQDRSTKGRGINPGDTF